MARRALIAILLGVLVGFVNGIITVRLRVPSLITTLGTLFLLQGVAVSLYNSQPIVSPVQEPFNPIFGENLFDPARLALVLAWPDRLSRRSSGPSWSSLVLTLVLNRTIFGLHTISTGSNLSARAKSACAPIGSRSTTS